MNEFLERWAVATRRSEMMLEAATRCEGSYRPSPALRTIAEQAAHIKSARASILRGLESGDFAWQEEAAAALTRVQNGERTRDDEVLRAIVALAGSASESWLAGTVDGMTRREWLWLMLEHELHHVGQLSMSIRLSGGEPAMIFA